MQALERGLISYFLENAPPSKGIPSPWYASSGNETRMRLAVNH
jgi:hypothetical protein